MQPVACSSSDRTCPPRPMILPVTLSGKSSLIKHGPRRVYADKFAGAPGRFDMDAMSQISTKDRYVRRWKNHFIAWYFFSFCDVTVFHSMPRVYTLLYFSDILILLHFWETGDGQDRYMSGGPFCMFRCVPCRIGSRDCGGSWSGSFHGFEIPYFCGILANRSIR
jgi:hypothetical protein